MHKCSIQLLCLFLFIWVSPLRALDNNLTAQQSARLDSITSSFQIGQCCGTPLKFCLNRKDKCPIALHLYNFLHWFVQNEDDRTKIMEQLKIRYDGFFTTKCYTIDTTQLSWAGSPSAPIHIVAYVSSTCSMCKFVVGALYDSVTTGSLSGKAKLMAKPFGKGIGDIALCAANSEGKFWELFQIIRENPARYNVDDIIQMGKGAGIPEEKMRNLLKKPQFSQMVARTRREGYRNEVEVTPTFFINGKRYHSLKNPEWVTDAVLFEFEQKNAR